MALPRLRIWLIDSDAKEARLSLSFPQDTDAQVILAYASQLVPALSAVSSASLSRYDVYLQTSLAYSALLPGQGDIRQNLLLFLGTREDYDGITIPSPKLSLMEVTGRLRGIRVNLTDPRILTLQNAILGSPVQLLFDTGEPINGPVINGGLTF
jgi:hypothetical protein